MDAMDTIHQDERATNDSIVAKLKQWFSGKIASEIIELVAYECGYDVEQATNHLLEMAKDVQIPTEQVPPQQITEDDNQLQTTASAISPLHKPSSTIQRVIEDATRGIKIIVLMRGLPGSGKSYMANKIVEESIGNCANPSNFILSADDFFYCNGSYNYNASRISEAHSWNQRRAHKLITDGISPIIIDNTNMRVWELKPYCLWAVEHGYAIEILESNTWWAFNERELARRNTHQVPRNKIRDMMGRYERNVSVENLFEEFNLCYRILPPQPRNYPPILKNNNNVEEIMMESTNTAEEEATKGFTDVGTITSDNPFALLTDNTITPNKGFISFGNVVTKYPKEGLYDKSTMTSAEVVENVDMVAYLVSLFPTIPADCLKDVYEKCNADIDWTVDLLLSDSREILENYTAPQSVKRKSVEIPVETVILDNSPETTEEQKEKLAEEGKELKLHLEAAVEINREHYSPHMQKIKRMEPEAGPSQQIDTIIIDSDSDNEVELEISDESDVEEMMELNLGDDFVRQLDVAFGDPKVVYPKEFQPIIEIPKSLGRQLYALYLESIFKQLEAQQMLMREMVNQDEEFAKRLQAEEERVLVELRHQTQQQAQQRSNVPNQKDWENVTPEQFVEKLTLYRFYSYFPSVPLDSLQMILEASGNCYTTTVATLLESGASPTEGLLKIGEPVISDSLLQAMKEAYNCCNQPINLTEVDPEIFRQKAKACQQNREKLLQESNSHCSRGQFEVAYFYCGLAKRQTELWDQYGNLAAEMIITENFNKNPSFDTIDLHLLKVKEAKNALDIFLDRNIMLLQSGDPAVSSSLNIITGRGRNSPGGIPRIKPAVKKRLTARGLRFVEVNPGLLRAEVFKDSLMTSSVGG